MTDKARALRLQRIEAMLNGRLDNPAAAIDALMAELAIGEKQPQFWERLHAAASNGKERELGAAYKQVAGGRRFKTFAPEVQSATLTHAGHFFMGILGDIETAETFLLSALAAVPNQIDIFSRFERKFQGFPDKRRLLELYATAAANPPVPPVELVGKVVNLLVPLTAKTPLSDDACRGLVPLARSVPMLLEQLEAHCRKTGRAKLAAALIEQAISAGGVPVNVWIDWRLRVSDLYLGEAEAPEKALQHVDVLADRDPDDPKLRAVVSKLVAIREFSDRVTALVLDARRRKGAAPR